MVALLYFVLLKGLSTSLFFGSKTCDFRVALIMDPPFGGRVEPLAHTVTTLSRQYKQYTKVTHSLPVFWIFPYFMEPHLLNSLPNFKMLDYKVDYDNHPLFRDDPKGRKHGSPVRIFTNVDPK